MDDLVAPDAENGRSQDALVAGIDYDLHESLGLALFDRAADLDHRPLRNERRLAAFLNLSLRRARAPQGRIDVECIGGQAVGDTAPIIVEKVRGNDLEVIIRSMREGAFAIAVPECPDARDIGA